MLLHAVYQREYSVRRAFIVVKEDVHVVAGRHILQPVAHPVVVCGDAVDGFLRAMTVRVVSEGRRQSVLIYRRKLPARLPRHSHAVAVGKGIAYSVIGDGLTVERGQKILPLRVGIAVVLYDRAVLSTLLYNNC